LRSSVSNDIKPAHKGEYFRCPACGHYPLPDTPPLISCEKCGRSYPVENGIYDFRLDQ
jgi:transcription elongation factor Elf1